MKPVTQMLRTFTEPAASYEKKPRKEKSEFEKQLEDMEEVRRAVGPQAWPWFGPTMIFDIETRTRVGQPLRFGVAQIRGKTYRYLMELGKKFKRNVPREVMDEKWKEILFYEPPPCCTDEEMALMNSYAYQHGLELMTREDFVRKEFYRLYSMKSGRKASFLRRCPAWSLATTCRLTWEPCRYGQARAAVKITVD